MKKLLLLSLLATVASCDPAAVTSLAGDAIVGTFTLQSVNGDPLPAAFNDNGQQVQITAGTFTINGNATFTYSETWDGQADVTTGTWSKNGNTYTFDPTETQQEPTQTNGYATLSGSTMTLTVDDPGGTIVRILVKN